ncbi:MAG: phosphatase PAP2 family protein [Longimicrobiales bacterium]
MNTGTLLPTLPAALLAVVTALTAVHAAPAEARAGATDPAAVRPDTLEHARASFAGDVGLGLRLVGRGLTAPLEWSAREWLVIPAAAGVLAVVTTVDDDVEHFAETHQGPVGDGWFGTLEPFGEQYSIALVVGVYGAGWLLDRPVWRRTAVEATASSVVAAGIVTPTLKLVFGRARPRKELGPYEFDPFSGDYSFPSGHTTQAFAVASVIAAESDALVVDLLAYGVAVSVGAARIYHDAHFLSDVLAGAAIGTVVGRGMVRGGRELVGSAEPFVGASDGGLQLGVRLPVR